MVSEVPKDLELEVAAISAVVKELAPLDADARQRVVEYAVRALGMDRDAAPPLRGTAAPVESTPDLQAGTPESSPIVDIRSLAAEKSPRNANEMAAVVAYYLAELAPEDERKESISAADLTKYFKQATFPLPGRIDNTLPNASQAGYFDGAGRGKYKLNPIGYNLVAHTLPAQEGQSPRVARRAVKKPRSTKVSPSKGSARKTRAKKG